jgi:outer membrane protein assembly factor BamE (lipoprotein component of BamABCDE complex)
LIQKAHSLESKKLIYLRVYVVILLTCVLLSCTTNIKNHGYIPSKSDLEALVVGKDTKQSIAKKIGLPATAGLEGAYYYVRSTFNAPGFKSAQLVDRTVVVLSFDQRSKLKNIETFSVDNGNFVRLDYRITETGLDNQNILQQIIGSISGPSASSLGM